MFCFKLFVEGLASQDGRIGQGENLASKLSPLKTAKFTTLLMRDM